MAFARWAPPSPKRHGAELAHPSGSADDRARRPRARYLTHWWSRLTWVVHERVWTAAAPPTSECTYCFEVMWILPQQPAELPKVMTS